MKLLKTLLLTFFLGIFSIGVMYLNIRQSELLDTPVPIVSLIDIRTVEIDTTAKIIRNEGKLDYNVALEYAKLIYEAAERYTIDPILMLAIMSVESRFDHKAYSLGNYGLMQISHRWHKEKIKKENLFSPQHNIMAAAKIMKEYASKTKTQMLLKYNGSENKHSYAQKVMQRYKKYQNKIDTNIFTEIK